jgi:hypothetical protein
MAEAKAVAANAHLFESGVLKPGKHDRLVEDAPRWARIAGIPVAMLAERAEDHCSPGEVKWANAYPERAHRGEGGGILYVGNMDPPAVRRMQALAAKFIRNYIDARVVTLDEYLAAQRDGDAPQCSVLFVPLVHAAASTRVPDWRVQALAAVLVERAMQHTGIHVDDWGAFVAAYGQGVAYLVRDFEVVGKK